MASRTSESSYWDTQHLPHNQYNHSQHYYSSSPAMVNQQQPRQAPTFNSASEGSSAYSASPSNVYYGASFYQSTPINGMSGPMNNGHGAAAAANHQGGSGGPSSTFVGSNHGVNIPSPHVMAPYPLSNHSGYHLNNSGIYQRSHGTEFGGPMTQPTDDMSHHHQQQQQQQQAQHLQQQQQQQHPYHGSSQHSGSPTLDGSEYGQGMKQKRRQVRNACVNCQKACKRCDEGRPCTRCIKYGLTDTCQDSSRKERKRGVKRGPYKRRATTGSQPVNGSTSIPYPQSSSPFMVMDSLSNAPFLNHHNSSSHATSMSPHARNIRGESHQQQSNLSDGGQILESNLLNSPAYPSSAPGTVQRSSAPLANHDAPYNRDHFHAMQPPRFTSRYDYDRTSNPPAQSMYNNNGVIRPNALPPPVSAPASSTSFSSSPASGYSSRSLFSPPALLSANSANFLGANGHHRLHSDSSLNTVNTNTTASNSLSPRTPMSLSANGSGSMVGDLGLMGAPQILSANSSSSSPGGIMGKGNSYVHHPVPTTTTNLPPTATGAFLNPSSAPLNNSQPFPLHIPHSARWRSSNNSTLNGERGNEILLHRNRDEKEEHLAPIKLHNSTDSDLSSGNLSIRYQLPSPRVSESPRSDPRNGNGNNNLPKVDLVA